MWASEVINLTARPRDGDRVIARGRLSVYEARGEYQLFELGVGHTGEVWLVTDARGSARGSPFVVALFDGNFELLRRDARLLVPVTAHAGGGSRRRSSSRCG